jgi:BirA family biotin operon repressor/biotin-[acetyl-CoA-carboxylase] ligase
MDDAARLAAEGEPEGLVVTADEQSSGRGRHNRKWLSRPGDDLLMSFTLRPRPAIASESQAMTALAVAETVDALCPVQSVIKWPNDVRVRGAKIAGVLTEATQTVEGISVVVGIGLNVNSEASRLDLGGAGAVSMRELAGAPLDRASVMERLLNTLDRMYASISSGMTIIPAWRERLETIGERVEVRFDPASGGGRTVSGVAEDVDEFGRLMVRDESGRLWAMAAGEVTLQRKEVQR